MYISFIYIYQNCYGGAFMRKTLSKHGEVQKKRQHILVSPRNNFIEHTYFGKYRVI
jgi:hypothetical protein